MNLDLFSLNLKIEHLVECILVCFHVVHLVVLQLGCEDRQLLRFENANVGRMPVAAARQRQDFFFRDYSRLNEVNEFWLKRKRLTVSSSNLTHLPSSCFVQAM